MIWPCAWPASSPSSADHANTSPRVHACVNRQTAAREPRAISERRDAPGGLTTIGGSARPRARTCSRPYSVPYAAATTLRRRLQQHRERPEVGGKISYTPCVGPEQRAGTWPRCVYYNIALSSHSSPVYKFFPLARSIISLVRYCVRNYFVCESPRIEPARD